jgi:hypothetical protein
VNDRDIITTALAGCHDEPDAINVVSIALEFAVSEAESLVRCFSPTIGNTDYSVAAAHSARLKALREFINEHTDVTFKPEADR